jgi:hypothetical protein
MDLTIEKIPGDPCHDRYRMRMAGTSERDRYMRCFPDPLPSTHRMVYRWEQTKDGIYLIQGVEPIAAIEAKAAQRPVDLHKDPREKLRVELQTISDRNELLTKAAENGVETTPKMSKSQIIAAIVDKLVPQKLEPATV